ncbi:MAG: hypothetical protein J0L67_10520 [Cytophagales bacterium]|nr:hypothetical protein [Cytophagales bacterium]
MKIYFFAPDFTCGKMTLATAGIRVASLLPALRAEQLVSEATSDCSMLTRNGIGAHSSLLMHSCNCIGTVCNGFGTKSSGLMHACNGIGGVCNGIGTKSSGLMHACN